MTKNAIVVDDLPSMRWITVKRLKELGFIVIDASDGDLALQRLNQIAKEGISIDLIVSDLSMPNVGGIEFLKTVRAMPQFKDILFIMLLDNSDETAATEIMSYGATTVLKKTMTADEFKQKIKEAMEEK